MICPHCGSDTEKDIITTKVSIQKDTHGRMHVWTELMYRDGVLERKRMDTYSYYSTGEVNVINLKVFNGKNKLIEHRNIKHFKDGRQPKVENVK